MILADENIVAAVVARLRSDGFDVVWIAEASPVERDGRVRVRRSTEPAGSGP